ncbi:hypothetical protein COLO4_32344 [Corchorus olitorius]|uniref:Reverse transcriptase n=1 Tax=Corchorus olitorius TaxID=93759 RepID=A0A1R3GZQ1_9ROSI|nr:hypothetical protein COLO4_32344 [Corchorus olitorius]
MAWQEHKNIGLNVWESAPAPLTEKIGRVESALITWNSDTFGNVFKPKARIQARLGGIERALENNPNPFLFNLEKELQQSYEDLLKREELIWFQKSRIKWILSGDRNISYFHTLALVRRSKNKIGALKDSDGAWIDDKELLKAHAVNYFKDLFTEKDKPQFSYTGDGGTSLHMLNVTCVDIILKMSYILSGTVEMPPLSGALS